MSKNESRFKRTVSGLLAASMVLAACGNNDSAASDVAETNSTVTTPADTDPGADADAESGTNAGFLGSYTLADEEFGTEVSVTVKDGTRSMATNALPDHETGEFPNAGNPNAISAQTLTYEYPAEPTFVGDETPVRTTGVAVNGVKFEPGTAETVSCSSGESLRVEALQDIYDLGLDFNNAHVQPTGEYHYHGVSELLADAYSTDDDLVHVGFAADGYLIYYSKSGAYDSGYELSTETRSGTECVGSGALQNISVEIEGTTPDGTYSADWLWSEETGNLDSCNGIEIDGEYAYLITDTYPFVGRCLNGEVTEAGPGGAAPGGGAPDDAGPEGAAPGAGDGADLTEAAAALGISAEELMDAIGGPPPDFEAAAEKLGVSVEVLTDLLPAPPGRG